MRSGREVCWKKEGVKSWRMRADSCCGARYPADGIEDQDELYAWRGDDLQKVKGVDKEISRSRTVRRYKMAGFVLDRGGLLYCLTAGGAERVTKRGKGGQAVYLQVVLRRL